MRCHQKNEGVTFRLPLRRYGSAPASAGAEAAGMNPLQVGHMERGASDVKLSTIVKLAHALGTTASELLRSIR